MHERRQLTAGVLGTQLFGMRSFATLYCLLQFSTTFGTYALATCLVRPSLEALPQPMLPCAYSCERVHA
jgi:hypothetical protein